MGFLEVVRKVCAKIAPGRTPSFTEVHVVQAFEILGEGGILGRISLSRKLMLGEGITRTLVKHLRNEGLIEITKQGIKLSGYGKQIFLEIKSKISAGFEVPSSSLTVGPFNIAILVRDSANVIKRGVEQRDAAIKAGALGATTLICSRNKLRLPSMNEREEFSDMKSLRDMLLFKLKPKENDVIIIGSGENKRIAEIGAKSAALELLESEYE